MAFRSGFWKMWFRFVASLAIILLVWLLILVIGDHFFPKVFNKFKFVHYFILIAAIFKVRNNFLKKLNEKNEKNKENEN